MERAQARAATLVRRNYADSALVIGRTDPDHHHPGAALALVTW